MRDALADRWVARAWSLLVVSSALYFLADNEADNDLWMHLFSGRLILANGAVPRVDAFSYTAAGLPWIDHEWLTQSAFAAAFDSLGSTGLWMCKLAVALLTAWLVWLAVARRTRGPWTRGPVMMLVLAALARGYAIRPQIVSYLGVAALLAWLDHVDDTRPHPGVWTIVVPIAVGFAAWANAHGGFVVGLSIVALFAVAPRWTTSTGDDFAPLPIAVRLAMVGAALVAVCLTPYGLSLFSYVLTELRAPHPLTEWQAVRLDDPAHLPFLMLVAILIATLPFARMLRRRPWRLMLVATVAVMAVRQQRHVPLFALVAAAPLAEQTDAALAWLGARIELRLTATATSVVAAALLGLAVVQLVVLSARVWRAQGGIVYSADEYPVGAVTYLREHDLRGDLAVPLDWGGYALWHLAPAVKVSLDGRFATVYPPRVVEDNFAFFRGESSVDSARMLDSYNTTLALIPRGIPTALDGRADWHLLYIDSVAALFGKSGAPASHGSDAPHGWLAFP